MFVRLTRSNRARAGWLVALLYLFCVLAPGAALALGGPAAWLPAEIAATAALHDHDHSGHDFASHGTSQHGTSHQHGSADAAGQADGVKHQHDGTTSPGPCCAMHCLSAITADLPAIAKPMSPGSIRVSENVRRLRGTTPPLLDRPPNV